MKSCLYVYIFQMFYEQILNNHLLHEKLAENINKQLLNSSNNRSKDRSLLSTSQDQGAGPSTTHDNTAEPCHSGDQVHPSASAYPKTRSSKQGEGVGFTSAEDVAESLKDVSRIFSDAGPSKPEAQMSNSLNTDLNDILDLHVRI